MERFIKEVKATQEEARRLEKSYKLEYVAINADGTVTYYVYEKENSNENSI